MALRRFLFQQYAEPYHEEADFDDSLLLSKVVLRGVGGVAVDMNGLPINNVADPESPLDAATKSYVDSSIRDGLSAHAPVSAASTTNVDLSNLPSAIDGYTLLDGHRFLLKDQDDPTENGVYVYSGGALARAPDGVDPHFKGGDYFYVLAGEVNIQSAWVLFTEPPITVGTTPLDFRLFSGLGQVVAGWGLTKTGNQLDIGTGDGLEVGANSVAVDLDVNPALGLFGTSPDGKLGWLPDEGRGLSRDADGAFVKIPTLEPGIKFTPQGELNLKVSATDSGLEIGADGLAVKIGDPEELYFHLGYLRLSGVPANFKIGGVATGDFVTADNLTTLTSGGNGDNLHSHSPPPEMSDIVEYWLLDAPVLKGQGVYISSSSKLSPCSCLSPVSSRCIGVAAASGYQGDTIPVYPFGVVKGILSGASIGSRFFINHLGNPVNITLVPKSSRLVQVGIAINETDLFVYLHDYGTHARSYAGMVTTSMGETITTISGEAVTSE